MMYPTLKRIFDVLFAITGIVFFSPLLIIIFILIYIEDKGTILFKQVRIGHNRKPFYILKFRSMNNGNITRTGRWIRSTGLDEIPQFFNILKGDMSMVGPRPLTSDDILRLGWNYPIYNKRWNTKPGITGLAQFFAGRSARYSWRIDQIYLKKKSIALDFLIVFYSFLVNIFGKKRIKKILSQRKWRTI